MEKDKIRFKEKVGYGLGDAASSMFWKLFSMYLLIFYTDVFGISAAAAGTMFLITRIWDSCFDPVVGVLADRTTSKYGKFRPYLLWVAVPFGVIGVFTFYTPGFAEGGKLVYAYITYSLMMMIYSLINVPYASLLGVMSDKGAERTSLSSYRMVFAFAGSLLALGLIEPLREAFGGEVNPQQAWFYSVSIFAVIAVLFFWLCFFLTKERVIPVHHQKADLKSDIKDLLGNRPWWILLGAGVAALIFNSVRDGGAAFYFKYYINESNVSAGGFPGISTGLSLTTIYLVLGQAANIIGVIIAAPIANKIGKKKTFLLVMVIASVLSMVFYLFGKDHIVWIMTLQVMISICAGAVFPLLWSMYADIADYSEWKNGRRATGLIFSSSSMSQKFGWTIGGATTGWLLGFFGFQANMVQNESAQEGIRLMLSFLPAAGTILSVLFIVFYPLSEKRMEEISEELVAKRLESSAVNDVDAGTE
ncbi:MFS transporter [Pararcticibacter amylolyticus]|uniref:MFS transporter n=1 Tax=Pararcticibacter amylolyticus TaxID=2173175 RepID=A0A2U2PHU0_9SPHI|nr:MFS transporter [Pararcticibacter amylolyticus]PWG80977.1 MFS transporter [Pararcticibacter amylolyticus]